MNSNVNFTSNQSQNLPPQTYQKNSTIINKKLTALKNLSLKNQDEFFKKKKKIRSKIYHLFNKANLLTCDNFMH